MRFDLWRLLWETVPFSCSLLEVVLLLNNKLVHSYEAVEETRSPRPVIIGGEYELLDEDGILETHYRNYVSDSSGIMKEL